MRRAGLEERRDLKGSGKLKNVESLKKTES